MGKHFSQPTAHENVMLCDMNFSKAGDGKWREYGDISFANAKFLNESISFSYTLFRGREKISFNNVQFKGDGIFEIIEAEFFKEEDVEF
jgi:hypothetical protein